MASLDILHPLSGDHVQTGTLSVLVAYDFGDRKAPHDIFCKLSLNGTTIGSEKTKSVPDQTGTVTFDFADVAADKFYKIEVRADGAGTDAEDKLEVEQQPIGVIKDITLVGRVDAGPAAAANKKYTVSGTHRGIGGGTHHIHVLVYELKPGNRPRPFNEKWKEVGGGVEYEAEFPTTTEWKAPDVRANHTKHIHCRIKVYKVQANGTLADLNLPNSRGHKA